VFMLGPAANHYITVSHASNFTWREGHFRDLIGLMGDGLLTIDGEFHRRSRMIMLPAFHHKHISDSVEVIGEETNRALDKLEPGAHVELYAWTRSEEHTSELQSRFDLVCRLLLEKKKYFVIA